MSFLERWAMWFAFIAHYSTAKSRYRKYTGELYFVHMQQVVALLDAVQCDKYTKAAGWLHDTIEDVWWVSYWLLRICFGKQVADIVREVSDVSKRADGNRVFRKKMDLNHGCRGSDRAQSLKYADLICNTTYITEYDAKFAVTYMREKRELLENMTRGNALLRQSAMAIVDKYYGVTRTDLQIRIEAQIHETNRSGILDKLSVGIISSIKNAKSKTQDVHPDVISELDRQERENKP